MCVYVRMRVSMRAILLEDCFPSTQQQGLCVCMCAVPLLDFSPLLQKSGKHFTVFAQTCYLSVKVGGIVEGGCRDGGGGGALSDLMP